MITWFAPLLLQSIFPVLRHFLPLVIWVIPLPSREKEIVTWGFPIRFFNPVIPTQNFMQPRNPEGYFWHPTSSAYFQSRISPRFSFTIPNPELQIRAIQDPQKSGNGNLNYYVGMKIDSSKSSTNSSYFKAKRDSFKMEIWKLLIVILSKLQG